MRTIRALLLAQHVRVQARLRHTRSRGVEDVATRPSAEGGRHRQGYRPLSRERIIPYFKDLIHNYYLLSI